MNLFDFTPEETPLSLTETANVAYDQGSPILKDHEFDMLTDNGLELDTRNFRQKVSHPFPMGSLNKIKDAETLTRWMPEKTFFIAMPKLDGLSLRVSYVDGKLVQAVTRGNGWIGQDVTNNIQHTNIQKELLVPITVQVRFEGMIKKEHTDKFDKNLRNIAAGMIGAKDSRPELALIDCIAIDVIEEGQPMSMWDKLSLVKMLFPKDMRVPVLKINPAEDKAAFPANPFAWARGAKETWDRILPYALDGVVFHKTSCLTSALPKQEGLLPMILSIH